MVAAVAAPAGASSPGSLPQTRTEPSFGAPFQQEMKQLFRAMKYDSIAVGEKVFFPEAAYVSMKTGEIPDPTSDYADRLLRFYDLDLNSYGGLLFGGYASTLVRVDANAHLAQWIEPGVCENKIGYWHVPGVRLVVRKDGHIVSAGVFSLISWRGLWYVIHLGPNPRSQPYGAVDDFENGPGTPGPPGGC
jgi:hypothetical protein